MDVRNFYEKLLTEPNAKLTGILRVGRDPQIEPTSLNLQERECEDWLPVDLTEASISAMKLRYEAALNYDAN